MIVLHTTVGTITLELDHAKAPKTVENFLHYAKKGSYDGCIFHRVIKGFMIQGGGFDTDFNQRPTNPPIENEASSALLNQKGTIAMARTGDPHSASSQFFINLADNAFLNFKSKDRDGYGYCVFGAVTLGLDVVEKIGAVATGRLNGHDDVPKTAVVIERVEIVESAPESAAK